MRVQFIYTNQNQFPFPIAPLGILTLAAIIEKQGHSVAVTDLMFSKTPELDIENDIKDYSPDLVALSIRNYNNQDAINFESYIDKIRGFVDKIRKLTDAKVVCGGPGFTRMPEEIFQQTGVDFGLAGEAEESFPLLVAKLDQGKSVNDIPGIVMYVNEELHHNPSIPIHDLDVYPFQNVGLIDYQKYLDDGGYVGIETKRGCPNVCIYCDDSLVAGKSVRMKKPERVVDEIECIQNNYDLKDFYFADSLFTLPTNHFEAICRDICNRGIDIRFEAEATPKGINDQNARLLKEAGCIGIFFTIDTGSNKMLESLRKSFTKQEIVNAAHAFSHAKLPYAVCVNLGGPGETMETFQETISLLKTLPDYTAVFFGLGFKIERDTALDRIAQKEGVIDKDIDYIRKGIYFEKNFDRSFLNTIKDVCLENPGWIELHPLENDESDVMLEVLRNSRKRSRIKPGWLKVKELSLLRDVFSG
ncbi:MAG: radical SAM protein [Candidatus Brocadiaceae bacterium]|nr:radical SAM protein [Candidatus Brocadiaceae bacterium]